MNSNLGTILSVRNIFLGALCFLVLPLAGCTAQNGVEAKELLLNGAIIEGNHVTVSNIQMVKNSEEVQLDFEAVIKPELAGYIGLYSGTMGSEDVWPSLSLGISVVDEEGISYSPDSSIMIPVEDRDVGSYLGSARFSIPFDVMPRELSLDYLGITVFASQFNNELTIGMQELETGIDLDIPFGHIVVGRPEGGYDLPSLSFYYNFPIREMYLMDIGNRIKLQDGSVYQGMKIHDTKNPDKNPLIYLYETAFTDQMTLMLGHYSYAIREGIRMDMHD